mgnify:CR=1 FL=1
MNTGLIISGAGHAGLILWVLVGGFFHPSRDVPEVAVTSVSLLSAMPTISRSPSVLTGTIPCAARKARFIVASGW